MDVALVKMPYTGSRNVPEISPAPDHLDRSELHDALRNAGVSGIDESTVRLDDDQERAYGTWHRMGLASGNLARIVADHVRGDRFPVGLLGNCVSLLGMLAGLQRCGPTAEPRRVGLLFLDAHGDFNTPETTLSGMLGGMPVAVAAGLCLTNLRLEAGLDPAVPTDRIVMAGLRDVDPDEQTLIDRAAIEIVRPDDLGSPSLALSDAVERLAAVTDAIYVHVDMDVLDTPEVRHHHTAVPGGPTSVELAATLRSLFAEQKIAALGIASTPAGDHDIEGRARRAAHRLIAAAVEAVVARG